MIWDDDAIARLREMVKAGRSQGELAAAFGLTRNAIAGRLHRFGLRIENAVAKKRREMAGSETVRNGQKPIPEEIIEEIVAAVVVDVEPVPSLGVPLDMAGVIACRYPLWDTHGAPHFPVCGEPTPIGSAWCSYHRRLVYPERRMPLAAVTAP